MRAPSPKRSTWTFVPSSWEPNAAHRELAKERGLDFGDVLLRFRNHEFKTQRSDADRAFTSWIAGERQLNGKAPAKRGPASVSIDYDGSGDDSAALGI